MRLVSSHSAETLRLTAKHTTYPDRDRCSSSQTTARACATSRTAHKYTHALPGAQIRDIRPQCPIQHRQTPIGAAGAAGRRSVCREACSRNSGLHSRRLPPPVRCPSSRGQCHLASAVESGKASRESAQVHLPRFDEKVSSLRWSLMSSIMLAHPMPNQPVGLTAA